MDCVFLNIGQHITALAAGCLTPGEKDLLFVGTPNNLLAYDVENNQDVFYKEVAIYYTPIDPFSINRFINLV